MSERAGVKFQMSNKPLQYKISSWRQLVNCKSNNDRDLRISVTDLINNDQITGLRISVVHPMYGVLFSEVLTAKGSFISNDEDFYDSPVSFELDSTTILKELYKFGFIVSFNPREHLPEEMISYLETLQGVGFDKLRILGVWRLVHSSREIKSFIVGFKSSYHESWLNNIYMASQQEFTDALLDGTAMNIGEMQSQNNLSWTWLDYVANIQDILEENKKA